MSEMPKTRFSGYMILIISLLILIMGIFTILSRIKSEDKLVKLGFVKLKQYSTQLHSKIDVLSKRWNNDYSLSCDSGKLMMNDTLDITDSISYGFLDRIFFGEYVVFDEDDNVLYKSFDPEIGGSGKYLNSLMENLYLPASYQIFNLKKNTEKTTFSNTGFISKTVINYSKFYQFVYPFKINDKKFFISGLLTNKSYIDKKQHAETWVLIVIAILLLFALFSFPFIKLFLLSKTERIKTSDMVMLSFSISGIACIVTLLIINISTLIRLKANTENQLKILSENIEPNFVNEMNLMYQTVEGYEELNKSNFIVKGHVLTDSIFEKSDSSLKCKIINYPYFKDLFCSDTSKTKNIITTWETDSPSKVTYRDYFKKKDEWLLPGTGKERRFRLQSIFSNTTGDVIAVLAKPSKTFSDTVYCISSPMFSVINTVLPKGFEFRIIGEDGTVWFHDNPQKNTRENFLDECDRNDEIQEAIHNRVEISFPVKKALKNYQMRISPIGTLPLYVITLCNTQSQNEFLSHLNYVLFIYILIGMLFAIISTAIFFYEKIDEGTGKLPIKDEEPGLIWILADHRKKKRYIVILSLNLLLGLFISLPVLFIRCTVLHFLLILFSAYSICFIYTYLLLKSIDPKVIKNSMIITFGLIILTCNIIYLISLSDYYLFFAWELAVFIVIGIAFMVLKGRLFPGLKTFLLDSGIKKLWSSKDRYLPYTLFACSWLLLGSILPTIYLFKIAEREEIDLVTRNNQLEIATKIERKGIQIDSFYVKNIYPDKNPAGDPFLNTLKTNLKQKGNYLINVCEPPVYELISKMGPAGKGPDTGYIALNKYLRQMIYKEDFRSYQMLYGVGLDTSWFWTGGYLNKPKCDILTLHYQAKKKNAGGFYSGYQFSLSSKLHDQKIVGNDNNFKPVLFYTAAFLLFLPFLFLLTRLIIKKLFIIERPEVPNKIVSPEIQKTKNRTKLPITVNTFLINTLDHDHINEWLKASYSFTALDKPLEKKHLPDIIFILKPLPQNPVRWNLLISTLEGLIKKDSGQLILLSPYTPVQIMEIIDEQIRSTSVRETKEALAEDNQALMRIFSGFVVSFIQDKYHGKELSRKLGLNNRAVGSELVIGNIEGGLVPKSNDKYNLPGTQSELYDHFIPQYQYLWNNCTTNEKFILFDLSTDSLVNARNREDIKNLVGKGILEVYGKLCFVSKGFKRYVTELVDSEEFKNIEKNSKRGDGWNKIKNPLYIIFGVIVVFFFFTQHELITGLNGAIISISGILGTLMKFLFGKSSESGN